MFRLTVAALCRQIAEQWQPEQVEEKSDELVLFVLEEYKLLPIHYRLPIRLLTLCFCCYSLANSLTLFHRLDSSRQRKQLQAWRQSCFTPFKLLVRFFQSLVLIKIFSSHEPSACLARDHNLSVGLVTLRSVVHADVVVVGSGPGGAISAALLAEAGFQVLLIEEGPLIKSEYEPFSASEMSHLLRYGGLGVMLGRNSISYLEGRCVGGASEVNSGLYLRAPAEVLIEWQCGNHVQACKLEDLMPYYEKNETELNVTDFLGTHPMAGQKLEEGAQTLGWRTVNVKKWRSYPSEECWSDHLRAPYRSMSKSFLPRFVKAGGQLLSDSKVVNICEHSNEWQLNVKSKQNRLRVDAKYLFLTAGAVQTPALMRRSGIKRNIGNSLHSSLIIKVIARFSEEVNSQDMGMPVQQVREFAPHLSFACGISSKAQLALGLQDYPRLGFDLDREWTNLAIYTVILSPQGRGKVRLPLWSKWDKISGRASSSWVTYSIQDQDWLSLGTGLKKLSTLLLAAGATEIYPVMKLAEPLRKSEDISRLADNVAEYSPQISALHLCGSCPMGENRQMCATDSYGKVHGYENLYINDASLLCSYPGANPQASIMAIARRNVEAFIKQHQNIQHNGS